MTWLWSRGWIGISTFLWVVGTVSLARAVADGASPYILAIASPSMILVGLVIGIRRPEAKVGQLLAVSGGAFACSIALLPLSPGGRPVADAVLVASHLVAPIAVVALIGALLVFPDGTLRSPRWKWIASSLAILMLDGVGRALAVVGSVFPLFVALADSWFLIGMVLLVAALVSLVLRVRTGTGVVRRQVGWLAYGVASYVAFLLIAERSLGLDQGDPAWVLIDQVFFTAIPLTIWVAVTRYRLYDLDRLVSRTVAYAAVVVVLAATYLGALTAVSSLLPVEDEIGVAVSTLAVVAMFSPVRRRVLAVVDRRFFRTRYQSQEVFDGFARRLRARTVVGTDAIEGDILEILDETLAPRRAGVWIRPS